MKVTKRIRTRMSIMLVLFLLSLFTCFGCGTILIPIMKADIHNAIQKAEKLSREQKYDRALQLLCDAMSKEYRLERLLMMEGKDEKLLEAAGALSDQHDFLIHHESSPLMQLFRDPNFPIEEKLRYITALREFVTQPKDAVVLGGTLYNGPVVQIFKSHQLVEGGKYDLLHILELTIKAEYISIAQQERIQQYIAQLRAQAVQKFQEQSYVEAFLLLTEAEEQAGLIGFSKVDGLSKQFVDMRNEFLQESTSPLIQILKNPQIPYRKKQHIISELRKQVCAEGKTLIS